MRRTKPNINHYQRSFEAEAVKNGLIKDLANLYSIEKQSGNVKTLGAIMALVPGIDRFEQIAQRTHEIHLEDLRAKVSDKCLETLMKIKPNRFESWEEAKNFDVFLHAQDGSMLAEKQREQFLNLRQQIRIEWTQQVASEGMARQNAMLVEMQNEQRMQEDFQKSMYVLMDRQQMAQKNAMEQLDQVAQTQGTQLNHLNEGMLSVQAILNAQDIRLDEQTLLLLQSDENLSAQITAVAAYLRQQGDLKSAQKAAQAQNQIRIDNYQGLLDGFGLLSAIGERVGNVTFQKIASVSSQVVLIHRAFGEVAKLASFAAISPYAAIGLAVLNIASLFMKQGPDAHQVILQQLAQLSRQIENMHRDMQEGFTDVHHHLNQLEQVIVRGFNQVNYFFMKPLARSLDEIRTEINQLSHLVQMVFEDLYLKDLTDCIAPVKSYIAGIMSDVPTQKVQKWLVQLAHWVQERSYNRQLSGLTAFKEDEGVASLTVSPKKLFSILQKSHPDFRSVINIFLRIAMQNDWIGNSPVLPHTYIWLQALILYLKLREMGSEKLLINYDLRLEEAGEIYLKTNASLESIENLISAESVPVGCFHKIKDLYAALLSQFNSLKAANAGQEVRLASKDCIPKIASFEYVTGKNVYRRKGHQRDFTEENQFTEGDVLKLIGETAKKRDIPLFEKSFLLAEKMGLIEYRCRMSRSMSDGAKRKYKTEGKAYGLEVVLYIRETQEKFVLTRPTPGYARWSHSRRHDTAKTMEWHKRALPEKTQFEVESIKLASVRVRDLLERRMREKAQPLYQQIAHELQQENSVANELLMYLQLGKMIDRFACFRYPDFDYQQAIDGLSGLLKVCSENPLMAEAQINKFFHSLSAKLEQIEKSQPQFTMRNQELQPLQDLLQGKRMMQQFSQSRFAMFGTISEGRSTNANSAVPFFSP